MLVKSLIKRKPGVWLGIAAWLTLGIGSFGQQPEEVVSLDIPWMLYWDGPAESEPPWDELHLSYLGRLEKLPEVFRVLPENEAGLTFLKSRDIRAIKAYQRRIPHLRQLRTQADEPHPQVLWTEPVERSPTATRAAPFPDFSDPGLNRQWYVDNRFLENRAGGADTNIIPAWLEGYSGAGVQIATVDEGVQPTHPEIQERFRLDLSFDFVSGDSDPSPETTQEQHGTAVAGIIAAAQNGSNTVGLAFGSELASLRALDDRQNNSFVSTSTMANVLNHQFEVIDIYNNSWGYVISSLTDEVGYLNITDSTALQLALENGVNSGRGGKGSLFVWAAGNSNDFGGDVNHDQLISSPFTITVGAFGNLGTHSPYSNTGAALHVVAPSSGNGEGIQTLALAPPLNTSVSLERGNFGGTSAAAPQVSAIIALMLEANPELTWRDVQYILLRTAIPIDLENGDWEENGAGYRVSHTYGFGRVNAAAAVRLARLWLPRPLAVERLNTSPPLGITIPDNNPVGKTFTLEQKEDLMLEHVQVALTMAHRDWGDLEIRLISPDGTESRLAAPFQASASPSGSSWVFNSLRHWGESARGIWTLSIRDRQTGTVGILQDWALIFRGVPPAETPLSVPQPLPDQLIEPSGSGSIDVLANDLDPGETGLTLLSVLKTVRGSVWVDELDQVSLEFPEFFRDRESMGYLVADGGGQVRRGTLEFIDPKPDARRDKVGRIAGQPLVFFPLQNDFDPDGDPLTVVSFSGVEPEAFSHLGSNTYYLAGDSPTLPPLFTYEISDGDDGTDSAEIEIFETEIADFSLHIDNPEEHARVPPSPTLGTRGNFTVEAWIYPESYGALENSGFGRIVDKSGFLLFLNDRSLFYSEKSLVFYLNQPDGSTVARTTPPNSIPLAQWSHVAVSYDGREDIRFYINGEPVPALDPIDTTVFGSLSGPVASHREEPLYIGNNADATRHFEGRIDEIRLWNRVRSPEEIRAHKEGTLRGFESGLIGYWPVIEARMTSRLTERSGISPDAQLQNTSWAPGKVPGLADSLWLEAIALESTWRLSDWFGLFFETDGSWIYHARHGWLYLGGLTEGFLYFYDPALQTWFWTNDAVYPYLYRYDQARWTFFDEASEKPRYFFNFQTRNWEAEAATH